MKHRTTKARMGVALMKAVPLVSFLVVLRRAWRLDQIMVKNRRRGNRGNPWGNLERNCYMRHVHDSDWFDMIWNDGFWPASCFWHSFHHFKHALACFGYSSCLSTMKTETENRFFFYNNQFVFCLRPPERGIWDGLGLVFTPCLSTSGRAFGSWHAPPLRCGLLWSCFSTSISGGRVGRCFPTPVAVGVAKVVLCL